MNRQPQLDALRGIAVLLVVLHHWTNFGHEIGLGNVGVQLFFVLSGFLITGILLRSRSEMALGNRSAGNVLAHFWRRRISRIWPVYFLTLFLVFLAGSHFEQRGALWWHALFLSNVLFFIRGDFGSSLAHFWTLAVEQQFYLVWPLVVLWTPPKYLERVILALICAAPLTRFLLYQTGFTQFVQYNGTPLANADSLGIGALMALWSHEKVLVSGRRRRLWSGLALVALVGLLVEWTVGPTAWNGAQSLYAVIFGWTVLSSAADLDGWAGRLLRWRPAVYLGTISYAVYICHVFAPRTIQAGLRAIHAPPLLSSPAPVFALSAILTLTVASLSWFFFERPILNWRPAIPAGVTARSEAARSQP